MIPIVAVTLMAALAAAPSRGRVVEAVVATIQASPSRPVRPITLTRLREEARVALVSRGATEAAFAPLDAKALSAALEWLIDQTLVAEEADRLLVAEVAREEAAAELRRFRARFASPEEYARFLAGNDTPEEELLVTLARNLRVQRFVERRVGQSVRPSEAEIDDYMKARGVPPDASAARDAVRAHLGERRLAAEVRKIVADLRGRATVRILLPPSEVAAE